MNSEKESSELGMASELKILKQMRSSECENVFKVPKRVFKKQPEQSVGCSLYKYKQEIPSKLAEKGRPVRYFSNSQNTKKLKIQIPKCNQNKSGCRWEEGVKVVTKSHFEDVNLSGSFFSITLQKGDFRRTNEDRVS